MMGRSGKKEGTLTVIGFIIVPMPRLTYACFESLQRELKAQGQEKFFFEHVMRAQPHLVEAAVHGVKVDMSVRESHYRSGEQRRG